MQPREVYREKGGKFEEKKQKERIPKMDLEIASYEYEWPIYKVMILALCIHSFKICTFLKDWIFGHKLPECRLQCGLDLTKFLSCFNDFISRYYSSAATAALIEKACVSSSGSYSVSVVAVTSYCRDCHWFYVLLLLELLLLLRCLHILLYSVSPEKKQRIPSADWNKMWTPNQVTLN